MGFFSAKVHRALDFLVVIIFAVAPWLFKLHGNTEYLAYGLAVVHLAMTLLTQFPGGTPHPIPFRVHGAVEAAVGAALVIVPKLRHWTGGAGMFYPAVGVAILLVWAFTRYREVVAVPPGAAAAP